MARLVFLGSLVSLMGNVREGRQPLLHSSRTSFYLFAAVRVPSASESPQTVIREESSIYDCQYLLKTGLFHVKYPYFAYYYFF